MSTGKIPADFMDYSGVEVNTISSTEVRGFAVLFDAMGAVVRVGVSYDRRTATMSIIPGATVDVSAIEWVHEHGSSEIRGDLEELVAIHRDWLRDRDVMLDSPRMWDCTRLRRIIQREAS